MNYEEIYNQEYFSGKTSFFYKLGYGRFSRFFFDNKYKQIARYTEKQGRVLDVGCAYGFMLQRFPESFEKFGLDVSEHAIDVAKKVLPNATFKVGNAEDKLPFNEDFFDIVLLNDVIEHLEDPKLALENILRVLKKEGILYINTPNLNIIRKTIFKFADEREHHISLFPHSDLITLLKNLGFKIVKQWTFLDLFIYIRFKSNIGTESAFICKK
ncbi:MAG: class I SAM-dependent methyltransferase [Candidatus Hydrothermarchaeales archaeon]